MSKNASRIVAGVFVLAIVLFGVFFVRSYSKRKAPVTSDSPFYNATVEKMRQDSEARIKEDDAKYSSDKSLIRISIQSGVLNETAYYKKDVAKKAFTDINQLRAIYNEIKAVPVDPIAQCFKTLKDRPVRDLNAIVAQNLKTDEEYLAQRLYVQKVIVRAGFGLQQLLKKADKFCGTNGDPTKDTDLKKVDVFLVDLEKAFSTVNVSQFQ